MIWTTMVVYKPSVLWQVLDDLADQSRCKLILVRQSAQTAGEGKTTTTIGLSDAFKSYWQKATGLCSCNPQMGPCFWPERGAAGGGYRRSFSMEKILICNFTGGFMLFAAANISDWRRWLIIIFHHVMPCSLDIPQNNWQRVVDYEWRRPYGSHDRMGMGLRMVFAREDRFVYWWSPQKIMAIFCLPASINRIETTPRQYSEAIH